jgi:tight adherence protein C
VSAELAGLAGLLLFCAAWEAAGMRNFARGERAVEALERLLPMQLSPARAAGAMCGALAALAVAPGAPGRLAPIVAVALVAAGYVAPDAWADRKARRRRAQIVAALPDALDLVAVGTAAGRRPMALFAEIAGRASSPLAGELALAVAEIEAGEREQDALEKLRQRTGAGELGAVASALERSRNYGSPLSEQLHAQAASLRQEEQRRVAERAARAAPKIQLVIALVLVPSALLAIAAALVAHSDTLFATF